MTTGIYFVQVFIRENLKNYFNFLVNRTNPAFSAGYWFNTSTLGSIPILGSGLALRFNTFYFDCSLFRTNRATKINISITITVTIT
jgi:hypothetical protein